MDLLGMIIPDKTITIGKGLPLVEREDWRPQALGNSLGALTYCGLFIDVYRLYTIVGLHYTTLLHL